MAFMIHWNCRGLLNNLGDIKEILNDFSPVALCLQETNLGDRYQNILKRFTVVRRDRTQASRLSGGVAVVVKGGIAVREIHIHSHHRGRRRYHSSAQNDHHLFPLHSTTHAIHRK